VLALDEVAGEGDQIGWIGAGARDELVICGVPDGAGVEVGQVKDAEVFEFGRKIRDRELGGGPFEIFGGEELEAGAGMGEADGGFQYGRMRWGGCGG